MDHLSHDFDFEIGAWTVTHRRLKHRLAGSQDWEEFGGTSSTFAVLGGNGNVEDNLLNAPSSSYRAIAVRQFDPSSQNWAIWWLDQSNPHQLDVPVIGRFDQGVGAFYAEVTFNDRPVRIRFLWTDTATDQPKWEQAFSTDEGQSWEVNWIMVFHRA